MSKSRVHLTNYHLCTIALALSMFLVSTLPSLAQVPLKLEDCFLPSKRPTTLRQLQWVPVTGTGTATGPEKFVYVQTFKAGDYLLVQEPRNPKADTLLKATDLDTKARTLPALKMLDDQSLYTRQGQELVMLKLAAGKVDRSVLNTIPQGSANEDVHQLTWRVAYTAHKRLWVVDKGAATPISYDTTDGIVYGQSVHQNEFGISKGTFWSPAGDQLAFYRMDERKVGQYPLVEMGTKPAVVRMLRYPMAGQTSHHVTIGVYNLASKAITYLKTTGDPEQYLTNVTWSPDGKFIYVAVLNRDQNHMQLQRFDAATGALDRTLFEEHHAKYVEPEHGPMFLKSMPDHFMWYSERDGHNHLYLYRTDGLLVGQLTKGDMEVLDVLGQTAFAKQTRVWLSVTAKNGLDRHLASITFDLKGMAEKKVQFADWNANITGVHSGIPSPSGRYLLDTWSDSTLPYRAAVWDMNLKIAAPYTIYQSANPLAEHQPAVPKLVQLKTADGTVLNGRLITPPKMEPGKRYPTLVYVYGGPHAQLVTNSFNYSADNWMLHFAQEGYVVFTLDNRGSANRGLNFENVTHRQLGTVEMQDQLQGLQYLKGLSFVDTSRLGVYGWSFGGFMTTSLMCRYPNAFKAGCAGGAVIDWSLYEIMYTERYMDSPQQNPAGYAANNLLNHARNLKGKLMLIHGTVDNVVVWQHTQEMAKQLVKDKKLFEYMPYIGHPHNVGGPDRVHLFRTIKAYFDRSL